MVIFVHILSSSEEVMRKYYQFEIEANEKPILNVGEWETLNNYTHKANLAEDSNVVAYGEVEDGKYVELYSKPAI